MSGFTKATLVLSVILLVVCFGLAAVGIAWAAGCVLPLAALAGGYLGGSLEKGDPAKTARNTRRGAIAGLIIGVAGLIGRFGAVSVAPTAEFGAVDFCLLAVVLAASLVLGGIGGWAYARHEHERQTGYKPT